MFDLKLVFPKCSFLLSSLEDTVALSKQLFHYSLDYSQIVFLLDGDLGMGKTTFVKSFLSFAGIRESITSPSYSIMNYYQSSYKDYYHMDLYRLSSEWDFEEIGAEEVLSSSEPFCFLIEWASLFPSLWEDYKKIKFVQLKFSLEGEDQRKVDISFL